MNQSMFIELVGKWFPAVAGKITETINGKPEAPRYLHEQMLQREFSPDLRWDSASLDGNIVAADVVSMDSELPVKRRDSLGRASGDIPKLGMKMQKGEKLITDLQIMAARGVVESQIVARLFADAPRCAQGIKERNEEMFLGALQTGVVLIESDENVGTAIRADFGYLESNRFTPEVRWGGEEARPVSDLARVIQAASDARGVTLRTVLMSRGDFNALRRSQEARDLSAVFRGLPLSDRVPVPTGGQLIEALRDELGVEVVVVDRSVQTERDGKRRSKKAFADGVVVLLPTGPTEKVGRLIHGQLAEESNPVEGVKYERVDGYILLSKYSKNDPLREFTASQALCLPVLDNVERIYTLHVDQGLELAAGEVEGDEVITLWGRRYRKAEVLAALKGAGLSLPSNTKDSTVVAKINGLDESGQAQARAAVEALTPVL